MARFVQPGHAMDYHNTGTSEIKAGSVVKFDDRIGVAKTHIPAGEVGVLAMDGVWELPKKSGDAVEQGDLVKWGATKIDASGTQAAGMAWAATEAADTHVLVKIG